MPVFLFVYIIYIGGPKCPTRKLSELIDTLLKPFLNHVKSYIRDSIDFLNKCDRSTDGNTVIATFDVVGLYTNIPHTFGMEAVRYFLLKYKEDVHPRFNIPFILESIDFTLKKNTCVFDNECLLQLQGTARGTVFAPTYANLSMGYHEIKLYDLIKLNYNLDIRQYFVENWKRFLDDCEILLNTDLIKPDDLSTILNFVNNDIQFSMELNDNKLPFLDILTTISGKKIWMNIYSKPTDSKRYVSYICNHPKPCLKNIPFCLARCICMIVENKNVRYMKLKELRTILKTQKYPKMVVEKGIEKARAIPQAQLRSEKLKKKDDILPSISTCNPNNPNMFPKSREI